MAKDKRFPAPANQPKKTATIAKPVEKAFQEAKGVKQDLVQLHYKKKNHHIIEHVHALRDGINSFPKSVWDKNKSHPAIQQLMKDGHLVDLSQPEYGKTPEAEEAPEIDSAPEETSDDADETSDEEKSE